MSQIVIDHCLRRLGRAHQSRLMLAPSIVYLGLARRAPCRLSPRLQRRGGEQQVKRPQSRPDLYWALFGSQQVGGPA